MGTKRPSAELKIVRNSTVTRNVQVIFDPEEVFFFSFCPAVDEPGALCIIE